MASDKPDKSASIPYIQSWASQTLFAGSMGSIYGLLHAFLYSKPMNIYVTSYGINTALFTGAFLGCRHLAVDKLNANTIRSNGTNGSTNTLTIDQLKNNELYASTFSSAVMGGIATGSILGLQRVPQGIALWTVIGYVGQYGYHVVNDWRESTAQQIRRKRNLNGNHPPSPPLPISNSTSIVHSSPNNTKENTSKKDITVDSNRLHVPTFSSWLPVSNSTEESQFRQKQKLLLRLQEINELLGIEIPPADPRVAKLDELEQSIIAKEKQQRG